MDVTFGSHRLSRSCGLALALGAVLAAPARGEPVRFAPADSYVQPGGTETSVVAVGDVSGDARNDVLMLSTRNAQGAPQPPKRLSYWAQNGERRLELRQQFETTAELNNGYAFDGLAIGDLDGDGDNDVVANTREGVDLFEAERGALSPARPVPGAPREPGELQVVDMDGDGDKDILTGFDTGLLENDGAGNFTFRLIADYGAQDLAVGDLNSDGRLDVARHKYLFNSTVELLLQRADGQFDPVAYRLPSNLEALDVGDFTGDGRDDVVATRAFPDDGPPTLDVLAQPPDQSASYPLGWFGPGAVRGADFDRDGSLDAVTVFGGVLGDDPPATAYSRGSVFTQSSDGFVEGPTFRVSGKSSHGPEDLAVGDVSGDGRPDVVAATWEGFMVARSEAVPTEPPPPPPPPPPPTNSTSPVMPASPAPPRSEPSAGLVSGTPFALPAFKAAPRPRAGPRERRAAMGRVKCPRTAAGPCAVRAVWQFGHGARAATKLRLPSGRSARLVARLPSRVRRAIRSRGRARARERVAVAVGVRRAVFRRRVTLRR